MTIFVVIYRHRHDDSVFVHASRSGAEEHADRIMEDRASEDWEQGERDALDRLVDFSERIAFFHDMEQHSNHSESIDISEQELQP